MSVNVRTVTLKNVRNTFNWIEQECLLKESYHLEEHCEEFPAQLGTKYQFGTHPNCSIFVARLFGNEEIRWEDMDWIHLAYDR
jgi:hypothetical protein